MNKVNEIIEALSLKYREGRKNEQTISDKIDNIYLKLQDNNISHKEFIYLTDEYNLKQNQLKQLKDYNDGLHDAREIVMNFITT